MVSRFAVNLLAPEIAHPCVPDLGDADRTANRRDVVLYGLSTRILDWLERGLRTQCADVGTCDGDQHSSPRPRRGSPRGPRVSHDMPDCEPLTGCVLQSTPCRRLPDRFRSILRGSSRPSPPGRLHDTDHRPAAPVSSVCLTTRVVPEDPTVVQLDAPADRAFARRFRQRVHLHARDVRRLGVGRSSFDLPEEHKTKARPNFRPSLVWPSRSDRRGGSSCDDSPKLHPFRDVCLIDSLRSLGVPVEYEGSGPFRALGDGNPMLRPFGYQLVPTPATDVGHGYFVLWRNNHFVGVAIDRFGCAVFDREVETVHATIAPLGDPDACAWFRLERLESCARAIAPAPAPHAPLRRVLTPTELARVRHNRFAALERRAARARVRGLIRPARPLIGFMPPPAPVPPVDFHDYAVDVPEVRQGSLTRDRLNVFGILCRDIILSHVPDKLCRIGHSLA